MATSITLKPPEQFDFRHPDEWPKWKRRFTQYLEAIGLGSERQKISTLLYCIGVEGDKVLSTTNITADERKDYVKVIEKFDSFFKVRRNVIFERAKFNRRDQAEGESAERYITTLYSLIETCEYGELKDEMLRDRIVVGIRDKGLSDKLQMDATLTLETAKKLVRQKEAVREHRQELQGAKTGNVDGVSNTWRSKKPPNAKASKVNPQASKAGLGVKTSVTSFACAVASKDIKV